MTWTLVQKTASVTQASAGTVTGTLPAGSTAGNLLVAFLGSGFGGSPFTGPAGWTQGPQVGNGSVSRVELWYYPGNPGGISSAAFTSGTGSVRCVLAEFSTSVAGATVSLDFSGTGTAGAVASVTATASATSGDLACFVCLEHFGSAQALTWTDPAGFTLAASMLGTTNNLTYTAYNLSTGSGSLPVTGTSSLASASANAWTGAVATFKAISAATTPLFIGATISTGSNTPFPAGTTAEQAQAQFASWTGRPLQVRRVYFSPGQFPVNADGSVNLAQADVQASINAGRYCVVSFKPSFNPTSQADYDNLIKVLTAYQNAGLQGEVGLWHEPSNPASNLSPAQFAVMSDFYASAITPFFPFVYIGTYWSAAGDPQQWTNYFNACPAGTFSKGYIDFYARMWTKGATLDGAAAACDAQGIPLGLGEWGCSITNDGLQNCKNYFTYITNFFSARKAAGTASHLIWFNNGTSGLQIQAIGSASDPRIPSWQTMFDTLTSSGAGTVTTGAALNVAFGATATASGGAVQQTSSNPGAAGPPGFPVLIAEIGVVPTSPVPAPGTFLLGDPTYGLLGLDVLGGSTVWSDISSFVKSFTTARTSTRQNAPVITYDPGTLSATLDNTDGRFDPDNLTGPYVAAGVTQIHPMTPARMRAAYQGTVYPLFSGFADSWQTPDTNYGPHTSETNLSATDGFKVLAGYQLAADAAAANLPVGAGEDAGARAGRLLDMAGWDNDARALDTGNSQLQGTQLSGPDALTEMQLAADTELGELYVNGAGKVTFRRRHGVMEDTRSSSPQATFGDNPASGGGTLNSNTGFENPLGTTGWTAQNGATLSQASNGAFTGAFFGMIIPDGVTVNPGITTSPRAAVAPNALVSFSAWLTVGNPEARRQMTVTVQFFDGGGTHLTAADATSTLITAPAWQQASVTTFAPSTAATCTGVITITGTPPALQQQAVDEAYLQVTTELPYTGLGRSGDDTQLCNDAQITAAGSSALQEAQDTASIAKFLYPRSYQRSDLLLESDTEALNWGQFVVYLAKNSEDRFDTITLSPQRDARLWPHALGREIGDMITVIRRPPNASPITKQLIIRGITHTVSVSPASWQTQWILQDASRYSFLTLGDPVQGTLDQNALAY